MTDAEKAAAESPGVAVDEPQQATKKDRKSKDDKRPRRQPPYNVILWNDDDHSYQYVIAMLQELFGLPRERGYQLAKEVDTQGKALILTTTLEHAELKRDQIHAYGKDDLVDSCKGAMKATIEAAPG